MSEKALSRSVRDTHKLSVKLAQSVKKRPWLILLYGPVGAGKTEWVKGFISYVLGKSQVVTSPTYSLMNLYRVKNKVVVHADLYLLTSLDDLESIGFWDYVSENNIVIAEWGELLLEVYPKDIFVSRIDFNVKSETERELTISSPYSSDS